jgi:hypothetical protein
LAAAGASALQGRALQRFETALGVLSAHQPCDIAVAETHLARLLALESDRSLGRA